MVDEIFDRNYQTGRAEFHAGLDRGFARIGKMFADSFRAFHRIQWSAPWTNDPRHVGQA
jgi:hypothetical protein